MKMLLIINPCSGRIKIKNVLFDVIQIFCKAGYTVTTHITTKRGNATEVAQSAEKNGYDLVVCCGGDGTLNEVITGIMRSESNILLAYIPAGSTNDFARTLGLETDIIKAAKAVVDSREEYLIDVGKFSDSRYFSYIASFGMFTSVSYNTQQSAKNALGHMAYVFGGIANIGNMEKYDVTFYADGNKHQGEYIYGGITNSVSVGGMFKFDESVVNLSDGLFEVLMVKTPKNANDYMKIFTGITSGDVSDRQVFDFCRASELKFIMPSNVVWTLDGEYAKGKTEVEIKNIHGKLRLLK